MSTYVWMRVLESVPRRYDFGIRLLSFGHIERVYDGVAQLARGPDVLDLGCGTGNVALRLARRGLRVIGVDLSAEMLDVARQKVPASLGVRWVQTSALELIDHFQPETFDTITSVLLLSELSGAEQKETLRQCHRLLRADGQLVVADEARASTAARRALHNLVRLPLAAVTYALTQTTSHAVRDLGAEISEAGFIEMRRETNRLGDFVIVEAKKRERRDATAD